MKLGLDWNLVRIEILTIEAYTFYRAINELFISTPKKLANTKCTINPNNSQTGDNMCLKYAIIKQVFDNLVIYLFIYFIIIFIILLVNNKFR